MGTTNMGAIYSNGGNRWNILGFNFTKRDALSSVYKISMVKTNKIFRDSIIGWHWNTKGDIKECGF